jgi:hypothetical protein
VFGGEEGVLVLARGVDNGDIVLDAFMGDLLEVGGLHGRVIRLDELGVDKLDDEGRLACGGYVSRAEDGKGDEEGAGRTDQRLWSRARRFCVSS